MSKEEMIAAIKSCAEQLGKTPTALQVLEMSEGKLTKAHIARRFGGYMRALEACGLKRQDKCQPRSAMEHFINWATIVRKLNKVPTFAEYQAESDVSHRHLQRRFQKWSLVHAGMLKFIEREKLENQWGDVAEIVRQHALNSAMRLPWVTTCLPDDHGERMATPLAIRTATCPEPMPNRPLYGEPILSPVMAHAPTNELGVMVLFGALAHDLGFKIMRVQAAFPDCEAMRRMANGRCQLSLIEFEFESRNFVDHMHDVKGCDLIVCWVHNWKECPLEVIELSRMVGGNSNWQLATGN